MSTPSTITGTTTGRYLLCRCEAKLWEGFVQLRAVKLIQAVLWQAINIRRALQHNAPLHSTLRLALFHALRLPQLPRATPTHFTHPGGTYADPSLVSHAAYHHDAVHQSVADPSLIS